LHDFSFAGGVAKICPRANTALMVSTRAEKTNTILQMPSSTESQIDEICARIRAISESDLTRERETELRKLAFSLRRIVKQHVEMAKSSLTTKKSAIDQRDISEN
jgi:hypothetical protein